jgi:lipid II:glycine glycyltransferase (peptidoglycan interpeptide bridge formation enzyme)
MLSTLLEDTMSQTTIELKQEIQKSLGLMRTLRDEFRVKLHLAGMDAKDEWHKLEPQLDELERTADQVSEATRNAVAEAVKRLNKLRETL